MGAKIPPKVLDQSLEMSLGQAPLHRGKIRDTYEIDGRQDRLLVDTTNRLSIFDFVLPALVPGKGAILTALTFFWLKEVLSSFPSHLVAYGAEVKELLDMDFTPEQLGQLMVVKQLEMLSVEAIVRGYLTGSGWQSYQKDQAVCGHRLPLGLHDGSVLPFPIFTPTTKAEAGHDEHVNADTIATKYGFQLERAALQLYQQAARFAYERGIIIADSKFEFGHDPQNNLVLADEALTPDSSRFWSKTDWEKAAAQQKSPAGLDKQPVREWGKTVGIDKRNPENPEDIAFVHGLEVPAEGIEQTVRRYRYIFYLLTGRKLERFQSEHGIPVDPPCIRIDVVIGSETDMRQISGGLEMWDTSSYADIHVHVISCHRNPGALDRFCADYQPEENKVIIAGAGMAAALPGVLKTQLASMGKHVPVIGVAFEGKNRWETLAAQLSIEKLPGQPVILAPDGTAYTGYDGFGDACERAIYGEFLPVPLATKPAQLDFDWKKWVEKDKNETVQIG